MKPLAISQCATFACLLEATAPKVGNVHRGADFEDLTFTDFTVSAVAIGPVMELAAERGVGATVLESVRATRQLVSTNTNLGIVLLLAPLAAVPREQSLSEGIGKVLRDLTSGDCRDVYEAIRLAMPGGMGETAEMDVRSSPPSNLLDAMRLAEDRDLVARQYTCEFSHVLHCALPWLLEGLAAGMPVTQAIVHLQLRLLGENPDSLIARKCGMEVANQTSLMARRVLAAGPPGSDDYLHALANFDFWLRADGHRRNPGTTADLIAASLFAALRDGQLQPPWN